MIYRIESVRAQPEYRILNRFADGVEGEVDLSNLVGQGVFSQWTDPREFERVLVDEESGTVAWPGGIDLAPDALHHELAAVETN